MKLTLFILSIISFLCAREVNVVALKELKSTNNYYALESASELIVSDTAYVTSELELPLLYLIEAKAKLHKMNELPPLMSRYIREYSSSDSLARVYYIASIYNAQRKSYVSALKACERGLQVVTDLDTTNRHLLLNNSSKLIERLQVSKEVEDALEFATIDTLKKQLVSKLQILKEKELQPMAGYPDGRYESFHDFKQKRAIPVSNVILARKKDKHAKYRKYSQDDLNAVRFISMWGFPDVKGPKSEYVPSYTLKIKDNGKIRKWNCKDGKVYAYAKAGHIYLIRSNKVFKLHVFNNYSWYHDIKRGIRVLNMDTGEVINPSIDFIRKILGTYPDLLHSFEDEQNKHKNKFKYLELFLKRSNPDPQTYSAKNI